MDKNATSKHIKTEELCDKCRYGFYNNCLRSLCECAKCPRYVPDAPPSNWRDVKTCQCLTIKEGEECPYYKHCMEESDHAEN